VVGGDLFQCQIVEAVKQGLVDQVSSELMSSYLFPQNDKLTKKVEIPLLALQVWDNLSRQILMIPEPHLVEEELTSNEI
jgi:hypothetical protein